MNTTEAEALPVEAAERISSVDMLRGIALLGILLMNIQNFGLPGNAYDYPPAWGGATGWNLNYWVANQIFFEGKMRFLFSLLFGAGMILFIDRAEARGAGIRAADLFIRRCLWLALFGMIHAYFIWEGDILFIYGVVGLGLYAFRSLTARGLFWATGVVLAVNVFLGAGMYHDAVKTREEGTAAARILPAKRNEDQKKAYEKYEKTLEGLDYTKRAESVKKDIEAYRGGYWKLFAHRAKSVLHWHSIFFYKYGVLDALLAMLFGMALYKGGVLSASKSAAFYAAGMVCGYALGIPVLSYLTLESVRTAWDPMAQMGLMSVYEYGRLTMGFGHLCLALLIFRLGWLRPLTWLLARTGQMALSNYLLTSVLMTLYFNGYGLGNFAKLERHQLVFVAASMWSINLVLSPIWLSRFRFGPVEWLWRTLTYWKRQPMRLAPTTPVSPSSPESPLPVTS
jgi:uncharacterized protein